MIAPTNWHWEEADPPPIVPGSSGRPKTSADAIAHAAALLKNGKKTGLVLGNLALHGEALDIAGRIAAKSSAILLSETFPSYHLARGEGRPPVETIPYEFEVCVKFLENFEQLIFVGALFPVATFAYRSKPTLKSPPGCALYAMASAEQDLPAALKVLAEATGATATAAPRQPRANAAAPKGELNAPAVGQTLCMLMPDNAILVDEGATNSPTIFEATKGAKPICLTFWTRGRPDLPAAVGSASGSSMAAGRDKGRDNLTLVKLAALGRRRSAARYAAGHDRPINLRPNALRLVNPLH